jgi:hypothetical protein
LLRYSPNSSRELRNRLKRRRGWTPESGKANEGQVLGSFSAPANPVVWPQEEERPDIRSRANTTRGLNFDHKIKKKKEEEWLSSPLIFTELYSSKHLQYR